HLENKTDYKGREKQATQLMMALERYGRMGIPVILSGDFNTLGRAGNNMSWKRAISGLLKGQLDPWKYILKYTADPFISPIPFVTFDRLVGIGRSLVLGKLNSADPGSFHIPWLHPTERPVFDAILKHGFNPDSKDGDKLADFRFVPEDEPDADIDLLPPREDRYTSIREIKEHLKSVGGVKLRDRRSRIAQSNETRPVGYFTTHRTKRTFLGFIGKSRLDWMFFRPGGRNWPCFRAYDPYTMRYIDNYSETPASDHRAISVVIPYDYCLGDSD
ncbi:MAG: hypothetical protein ABL958_06105, partial [Bdellovibrionia bacterium]